MLQIATIESGQNEIKIGVWLQKKKQKKQQKEKKIQKNVDGG